MVVSTMSGPPAPVRVPVGQDVHDLIDTAVEVLVVPRQLAGERGVDSVVQIVRPLRRVAVPTGGARGDHTRVAAIPLGDGHQRPPRRCLELIDRRGELFQQVGRRGVDDRMGGVDSEPVRSVLLEPVQRATEEVGPHVVALRAVDVEAVAPGGAVPVGEVGAERTEGAAVRAEVVDHHVHDHCQPGGVTAVDERCEVVGRAIRRVRRPERDAVVAPSEASGCGSDGHELDVGHAEPDEVIDVIEHTSERAGSREGPDVELMDDGVAPGTGRRGDGVLAGPEIRDGRKRGNSIGLPAGTRVGEHRPVVEDEAVPVTHGRPLVGDPDTVEIAPVGTGPGVGAPLHADEAIAEHHRDR